MDKKIQKLYLERNTMNYLVTHYKNLAEQLQSRINNIQQCLYEMDTGSYTSSSRKGMGPVNPPTHGGGLLPPQNPNRRPEYAGRSALANRTGGGFYDRPTNRPNRRPESIGDSQRPTNPHDPNNFYNSARGILWLANKDRLEEALRNPDVANSRVFLRFIAQFGQQTVEGFRQYLINQANLYFQMYGAVQPPIHL